MGQVGSFFFVFAVTGMVAIRVPEKLWHGSKIRANYPMAQT
jgi:hypothetical protein